MQNITASNQHALELAQRGLTPVQYTAELSKLVSTGEMSEAQLKEFSRAYSVEWDVKHRGPAVSSATATLPPRAPGQTPERDGTTLNIFLLAIALFLGFYFFEPHFHDFIDQTIGELRNRVHE